MTSVIKLKRSHTAGNTPSSLSDGEMAINTTDKKIWVGNTTGPVLIYDPASLLANAALSPISTKILNISTAQTAIDASDLSTGITGCEYNISCKDNINNRLRTTKVNFVANSTVVSYVESSIIATHDSFPVASFVMDVSGANVRLLATGDSTNVTVSYVKTLTGNNISNGSVAGFAAVQQVYVQNTRPATTGFPWAWWQTDANGSIIDLTVNDGTP